MSTPVLHATPELVTTAWLKTVVGDRVATTLPKPADDGTISWANGGFVTHVVAGGSSNIYVPLRTPVMGLSCWAVNPDSQKPPWGQASNLAEAIVAACLDHDNVPKTRLSLPGNFPDVQVKSAYTTGDPRRVPDDASPYARYDIPGLVIAWTEVPS
ncbi:hypothetical protein [Streptomyces chartreusis]|uniref:hypothetical protein n=1 Tax=Streptomyces chartreusis TaxID=1969 RepID=UPI00123E41E4|nr:hypothetical protein [Streptomyces chartreusis]QEV66215.1 hypothetical protein CP983_05755 [Streptomyces chartreusis]GGW98707.1 hypothetical protein GCM10010321_11390 [Streptomyces chartreusis]